MSLFRRDTTVLVLVLGSSLCWMLLYHCAVEDGTHVEDRVKGRATCCSGLSVQERYEDGFQWCTDVW